MTDTQRDEGFVKTEHSRLRRQQEEARQAAIEFKRTEALAAMVEPEEEDADPET